MSLKLPTAVKQRGRPKANKGYFKKYPKQSKKGGVKSSAPGINQHISSTLKELLDEEEEMRREEVPDAPLSVDAIPEQQYDPVDNSNLKEEISIEKLLETESMVSDICDEVIINNCTII